MAEDVFDLLGRLRRGLGQVAADALGPVVDGHRAGQMVKRIFPDEPDNVFGGIEARRVNRGVEEVHGGPLARGDFRQQPAGAAFMASLWIEQLSRMNTIWRKPRLA